MTFELPSLSDVDWSSIDWGLWLPTALVALGLVVLGAVAWRWVAGRPRLRLPPSGPPVPEPVDFSTLPPIRGGTTFGAEIFIGLSHLRSKKREAFVNLVTLLSVTGVVVGVGLLNCVIAVMTGFEVDLRDKILGANAHVVVLRFAGNIVDYERVTDQVEAVEGVEAAAPFVYYEMMIRSPSDTTGVIVKGIEPGRTERVTSLLTDLKLGYDGELGALEDKRALFAKLGEPFPFKPGIWSDDEREYPGILLGEELQNKLQVQPGEVVQLINPLGGGVGPMGAMVPSIKQFRVAGVYFSGMYEYDTKWVYVNNADAQKLLKIGPTVSGIEVKLSDPDAAEGVSENIDEVLGYPLYSTHWKQLNQKLFAALELEKWVMGLILQMVVVNAALLISSTLIMLVFTKGREIAILKAMGATRATVMRIFVMEGSLIGFFGAIGGTALGLFGCWFLDRYEYPLETDVYYVATLPVVVEPINVAVIAVSAFVICFVATLYPAYRAASLDPVEGLRYE